MIYRRYGNLVIDIERIISVEIMEEKPLHVRVILLGGKPEEYTGPTAQALFDDALSWVD